MFCLSYHLALCLSAGNERIQIMKRFLSRYSYESVHLFLNQVAIGLFGMTLALAASMAKSEVLSIVTSVFSVLFFLFLQYTVMKKIGAEDRLSCDLGKMRPDFLVPLKMWLLASIPSFFFALLIALRAAFMNVEVIYMIGGLANVFKRIIEGMYMGLLNIDVGGQALHLYWFVHFLTPLPTLAVAYAAYMIGFKNFSLLRLFSGSQKK